MADSHFLFLGYSMRDWNLRVILNRIWGAQQLDLKSWAVQRAPTDAGAREVEEALWRDRGDVDLLYVPLQEYVRPARAASSSAERAGMTDDSREPTSLRAVRTTPYVGLVPYGEEDAAFFFGRDDETRIVTGNLRASRADAALRRERRREDLAPAGRRRPRPARSSCARRAALRTRSASPFAVCVFSRLARRPARRR